MLLQSFLFDKVKK